MLGVVIWTDATERKAIVWCEDHGELAFLGSHPFADVSAEGFGQGDLIQFDLAKHRDTRFVRNPRKIAQHYCADLSAVIATAQVVKSEIDEKRARPKPRLVSFNQQVA